MPDVGPFLRPVHILFGSLISCKCDYHMLCSEKCERLKERMKNGEKMVWKCDVSGGFYVLRAWL